MTYLLPETEAETRVLLLSLALLAFGVGVTAGILAGRGWRG